MTERPSMTRLHELLIVDVDTGVIRWRVSRGRVAAGSVAGRINAYGYREVCVDTQLLAAHALVWFVATGDWPDRIDHINGRRADNRWSNLRMADAATNARNRTNWRHKKLLGAHRLPTGRYAASITADGVRFHLGCFPTEQEAHARYAEARAACARAEEQVRQDVLRGLSLSREHQIEARRLA